jgi:hypothetical protein
MTDPETNRRYDDLPAKVLAFLRGVSVCPAARTILEAAGYGEAANNQGWDGLHVVCGYRNALLRPASTDASARAAIVELDKFDEPGIRRIRAALQHEHPEQARFVLDSLEPAKGAESVVVVDRLLARLGTLAQGRGDATREADKAAMATLAKRGFTQEKLSHLTELVQIAQSKVSTAQASADQVAAAEKAMSALHAW